VGKRSNGKKCYVLYVVWSFIRQETDKSRALDDRLFFERSSLLFRKSKTVIQQKSDFTDALSWILFQRKDIGPQAAEFAFPLVVLDYIRAIVPDDIKAEFKEVINQYLRCNNFKVPILLPFFFFDLTYFFSFLSTPSLSAWKNSVLHLNYQLPTRNMFIDNPLFIRKYFKM